MNRGLWGAGLWGGVGSELGAPLPPPTQESGQVEGGSASPGGQGWDST